MATEDSSEVLERLEMGLPWVSAIAREMVRFCGNSADLEDLMSYGREGLLDASRRYDPEYGAPFRSFAKRRILGAMFDGVRQMAPISRHTYKRLQAHAAASRAGEDVSDDQRASAAPLDLATTERLFDDHLIATTMAAVLSLLGESMHDPGSAPAAVATDDPESAILRAEFSATLLQLIEALPAQEAALVRRHYLGGERFDEVASDLNMSKSWASKLHARGLQRLAKALRARQSTE